MNVADVYFGVSLRYGRIPGSRTGTVFEPFHAIREIIAYGLDEQILTGSIEIVISCDDEGSWHIRDFGKGLLHEHFTMNENQEKLEHPGLIGKFGVGLKDALATFDRLGIEASIRSRFCDVSFDRSEKHDFSDVITLHACISAPSDPSFVGTEFILKGCSPNDVDKAKHLFLRFSGEKILEKTQYGEVLKKTVTVRSTFRLPTIFLFTFESSVNFSA